MKPLSAIAGGVVILVVACWAITDAGQSLADFPGWTGVVSACASIIIGVAAVVSVARDRLR